jgi:hypothetical protein
VAGRDVRTIYQGPLGYWPFSLRAFIYAKVLLPRRNANSPWEAWNRVSVPFAKRIERLRVWGTRCFFMVPKEMRKKLDDKTRECLSVGYSSMSKAYVGVEMSSGRILMSPNVIFDETHYPCKDAGFALPVVRVAANLNSNMTELDWVPEPQGLDLFLPSASAYAPPVDSSSVLPSPQVEPRPVRPPLLYPHAGSDAPPRVEFSSPVSSLPARSPSRPPMLRLDPRGEELDLPEEMDDLSLPPQAMPSISFPSSEVPRRSQRISALVTARTVSSPLSSESITDSLGSSALLSIVSWLLLLRQS